MISSNKSVYSIDSLRETLIKLATLNIILCDEDWLRYHRFTKGWDEHVDLAKIDNGSGDNLLIFFTDKGCLIKGFAHESEVSPYAQGEFKLWDGMYHGLPSHFEELLDDESIEKDDVTFCLWRTFEDGRWNKGDIKFEHGEDDGSGFLLETIFSNATSFGEWATDYFEMEIPKQHISSIYNDEPITDELILGINASCDLEAVKEELKELGVIR